MSNVPASRPHLSRQKTMELIDRHAPGKTYDREVMLLGIRGYYLDTMGKPGTNDRGIYDDAMCVIWPEGFKTFNANTDPSVFRAGIASLAPGLYPYRKGNHGMTRPGGGYPALRPATVEEQLPVMRDGVVDPWPGVAINIHRGGFNSTSSEGCQTIYPTQWDEFKLLVYQLMTKYNQETISYLLIQQS